MLDETKKKEVDNSLPDNPTTAQLVDYLIREYRARGFDFKPTPQDPTRNPGNKNPI